MGARGKTPQRGQSGVTFTHDKCRDGTERRGWLSGDVHVLVMHVTKGPSKPCERALLGLSCDKTCPHHTKPAEEIGYVPLRRDDGRPVCVLVRKAKIDFVAHMRPGTSVVWGRMPDRFEGVYVRPAVKELPWSHYFTAKPDDDMSYWLPLFLGVPHLADAMRAWFAAGECQPTVTQPAAPLPEAIADVVPRPITQRGEGYETRVGEELDRVKASINKKLAKMKHESNGVHEG